MRIVLLCLIGGALAGSVFSQTGALTSRPAPIRRTGATAYVAPGGSTGAPFKPDIPASSPIFTLDGVCPGQQDGGSKSAADCRTVFTRGQLEALVATIDPEASPKLHQQFALSYARLLAATKLAEQQHFDKDPKIARQIQLQQSILRMQILTDYVLLGLQQKARQVADSEIEAYYTANAAKYEQAQVERVAIPLDAATDSGKPLDPVAAKAEMEELHDRVAKGDAFDLLQSKAYKDLGLKGTPAITTVRLGRGQSLSPEWSKAFEMAIGETSPVFENEGVLLLFRLVSKRQLALNEVRTQIETTLALQRQLDSLHAAFKGIDAEFNLNYFDARTQPELFPLWMMTPGRLHHGLQSVMKIQP